MKIKTKHLITVLLITAISLSIYALTSGLWKQYNYKEIKTMNENKKKFTEKLNPLLILIFNDIVNCFVRNQGYSSTEKENLFLIKSEERIIKYFLIPQKESVVRIQSLKNKPEKKTFACNDILYFRISSSDNHKNWHIKIAGKVDSYKGGYETIIFNFYIGPKK